MKQTFWHTFTSPRVGYASYVMAFVTDDGEVAIELRNQDGKAIRLSVSQPQWNELVKSTNAELSVRLGKPK